MTASSPTTIEQLAQETVQITDPETALRALTALRRELDATEPELVQRALHAGASWSHVARALGISKQAAHRKYRHLFELADAADQRLLVSDELRQSVQFAREEATRLGQLAVATEHILLGILRFENSPAVRAMNAEGVTLDAARQCLRPTLPGVPPPVAAAATAHETLTPQARRIVEASLREARQRGERHIGVEHLLLALLSDSRNGAVQTIEQLRASPARIRRHLEEEPSRGAAPAIAPPFDEAPTQVHVTSRRRPVSTS